MINALIFDFGGVLINLDLETTPKALRQWGGDPLAPEWIHLSQQYETGQLTSPDFIRIAEKRLNGPTAPEIEAAWNATILDLPEWRVAFLEALRSQGKYKMFLLSNTNALHMDAVRTGLGERQYTRFKACFDGFYLSHEVGMRKPNADIFQYVLDSHQLDPARTLFIDDSVEHIRGATGVGVQTWHFKPGIDRIDQLTARL